VAAPCAVDLETSESSTHRDKFLIQLMAHGDREAFEEIFDRLAPSVLGILVRILRQRSLAEETLQETFLQAWLQADRYRPEQGSPLQWLLVIAKSRGLDRLRRERTRQQREETFSQDREAFDPVGTSRLENQERRTSLRDQLKTLTASQRACLSLAFGKGLSQSEIAQQLSMPLGSVKSRLRLGMRKLARFFLFPRICGGDRGRRGGSRQIPALGLGRKRRGAADH